VFVMVPIYENVEGFFNGERYWNRSLAAGPYPDHVACASAVGRFFPDRGRDVGA